MLATSALTLLQPPNMKNLRGLTKDEALYYFDYDRERGILIWKNHWAINKSKFLNTSPSSTSKAGYICFGLKGVTHAVHRVIWFIETGEVPNHIDHIDGNKLNNKISNLRSVTPRENSQNKKEHREGKLIGASKKRKRWAAAATVNGKNTHIGTYDTELEAHNAYQEFIKMPNNCATA